MQSDIELLNTTHTIDKNIFRAYDIRGLVDTQLNEATVRLLGQSIASYALSIGQKSLIVARDGRLSGPHLLHALREGIMKTGCDVIDIGMVPTPLLYYATNILQTNSGVMLTGSHNPTNYNGLKIVMNGLSFAGLNIANLYERIQENNFAEGTGKLYEEEMVERYISEIKNNVTVKKNLKIVVDCGNGVSGAVVPELYRQLGCEIEELFCEVDGNFPNHHPDPSQSENLLDLINKVRETNADVGLAFDGDGDRLGVVTKKGKIIWADRQLMLFARDVLENNPGGRVIYDVKCTNHLATLIRECGGEPIMWKTGHSFIKAKLAETNGLLAGEMSGHIFFKDKWYGFDDAIYAGARLLEILSKATLDIDELFATIPDSVNTPELKIYVTEQNKFPLMEKILGTANFHNADGIDTTDGLRVNFSHGWGLVRPSNTTPCLVLRFEANNELGLLDIQKLFKDFLLEVDPALEIPF